ncbi:MAG: hypothetical protein IPP29_13355 [Bacteroidetes bacterium]|nr:hypothetical protein [Bacteroidota bacterium]
MKILGDTALQNFVAANKYNSIGLLCDVKTGIEEANRINVTELQVINNIDSINKYFAENIEAINQQLSINQDSLLENQKQNMLDSIGKYNQNKQILIDAKDNDAIILLAEAKAKTTK